MNKFFIKCLAFCSLVVVFPIQSASNEELYAVQKVSVDKTDIFLNGMGATRKLNTDYYIAALYLQEKSSLDSDIIFMNSPKRLELRFSLDRVSARSFGREIAASLKINNIDSDLNAYRNDLRNFIAMFRGIYRKGDRIVFDIIPKRGVYIRLNEQNLGRIKTKGFHRILMKAWIGEKPFSNSFKKGLVGLNDDKQAIYLLKSYVALKK